VHVVKPLMAFLGFMGAAVAVPGVALPHFRPRGKRGERYRGVDDGPAVGLSSW